MIGSSRANLAQVHRSKRWSSSLNALGLAFIFYLTAAASFSGYFGKWAFLDGNPNQGIEKVFDGSAIRPWSYRVLMPAIATAVVDVGDRLVPSTLQAKVRRRLTWFPWLSPEATFTRASGIDKPYMRLRYLTLYYLTFGSILASMVVMWRLCLQLNFSTATSTLAPMLFALLFPLLQTRGGYYYDAPELLFLCASVLLALQGRWVWLALLAIPATLNKEAYLFFVPSLYPLLSPRLPRSRVIAAISLSLLFAAIVNAVIKYQFRANGGEMVQWHLAERLQFFLDWQTYVRVEINYGVITAAGMNLLNLTLLVALSRGYWSQLPISLRRHALVAAAINVPLFLAFSFADELRNLSLLFPYLFVVMAYWITDLLEHGTQKPVTKKCDH